MTPEALFEEIIQANKRKKPLFIGITGAMAVGKSVFSEKLKKKLEEKRIKVSIIHTDGFLYPNKVLVEKDLMKEKGFPSSFKEKEFLEFLQNLKNLEKGSLSIPIYRHKIYDIDHGQEQTISYSDIYLIEGINLLSSYKVDFYDFLILLKRYPSDIRRQFEHRFSYRLTETNTTDYFKKIKAMNPEEIQVFKDEIWSSIHVPFREKYIEALEHLANRVIYLNPEAILLPLND